MLVDVLRGHRRYIAVKRPKPCVIVGRLHAAATAIAVVAAFGPVVAQMPIGLGATNRGALCEPQEILADIADVCSVVTIAPPAGVLPAGAIAGVVAKFPALPLRQIAVDRVARGWREQLDVRERAPRELEYAQECRGQRHTPQFLCTRTAAS